MDSARILTQVFASTKIVATFAIFNEFQGPPTTIMKSGKGRSLHAAADTDYRAFLIRCWREGDNWHFTLETVGQTRQQRHGFTGYQQLANFLKIQFVNEDIDPEADINRTATADND